MEKVYESRKATNLNLVLKHHPCRQTAPRLIGRESIKHQHGLVIITRAQEGMQNNSGSKHSISTVAHRAHGVRFTLGRAGKTDIIWV